MVAFTVRDTVTNQFIAFNSVQLGEDPDKYLIGLEKFFNENEELHFHYQHTHVSVLCENFSIVPNSFFDAEDLEKNMWMRSSNSDQYENNYDSCSAGGFAIAYRLPVYLSRFLSSRFHQPNIHHSALPLFEYLLPESTNKILPQVYAYVNSGCIEVLISEKGKLLFYNSFNYKSVEDMLYFILLAYHTHNLDAGELALTLIGEVEENSGFYTMASRYIHTIKNINKPGISTFADEFKLIPDHYYFNLFCAK